MFHNYYLRPMLLEEVSKPFRDQDYLYEIKFDGIRAFIYVNKNEFKIISRNGNDLTKKYPELREIQSIVGKSNVIFDGEVIATRNGIPSFSLLQKRNRVKRVSSDIMNDIPVYFIVFDILYDNVDLTNLSLDKRKKILGQYPDNSVFIKSRIYSDGLSLFKMVKKIGLEGIVAKKRKSIYLFGKRTSDWVKVKNIHVDNFIVHGYLEKTNTYSLLLGEYKNNKLKYVGKVSVNKSHEVMNTLKKMKKINNQFVNFDEKATYIIPVKTVRIHYLERTKSDMLRHATLDE